MKKDFIEILYENRKYALIICIILIITIILGIYIYFNNSSEEPVVSEEAKITLRLFGDKEIFLKLGEEYLEPGYYAIDSNGVILTKSVHINNNINTNKEGVYTISYQIGDILEKRTITVTKSGSNSQVEGDSDYSINLTLQGENVITLSVGEKYVEPGYKAISSLNEDLTDKVMVTGDINTNTEGTYTLVYSIEKNNVRKEVIRTIIVLKDNLSIKITPDKTGYTNTSVKLTITVTGNNFLTLTMPNNQTSNSYTSIYTATNNGTYNFVAYNKNGKAFSKSITINNIDKEAPNGLCSAVINENDITKIQVTATDNFSGINNYYYYDSNKLLLTSKNKVYTYNGKTSSNVSVRVYDNAGNYKNLKCLFTDNSEPDRSSNKVILVGDSRTEDMCKSSYCNACQGDKYFAKVGMGYNWYVKTAIPNVNSYLNSNPNESFNIFILLGVNDNGSNASRGTTVSDTYFNKTLELATTTWKNHYIYYVSINPVINSSGKETANRSFNDNMKNKIENSKVKNLKYCDTSSSLSINSSNSSDGVHYTCSVYRNIRNLLNNCLKK